MIRPFFDSERKEMVPALVFKDIWSTGMVKDLRDALADALENLVSYQDPKDGTRPFTLHLLSNMIQELTEDIEKGGEV